MVITVNWFRVCSREDSRLRLLYVSSKETGGQVVGFRGVSGRNYSVDYEVSGVRVTCNRMQLINLWRVVVDSDKCMDFIRVMYFLYVLIESVCSHNATYFSNNSNAPSLSTTLKQNTTALLTVNSSPPKITPVYFSGTFFPDLSIRYSGR